MKKQTAKETDYFNTFSIQIKKLLKENHLSQVQLAKAIGVTPNAVNEWINEKSQPKWLLQMFGTIKFFYENVKGFSPMDLFFIEDFDLSKNGDEPLKIPIEKKMEQIEQDCNAKIERIKRQAQKEIKQIRDRYNGDKIDELSRQVRELQEQVSSLSKKPKTGRQNYEQFKDKQNKKYDELKNEFEDYKEAYNGLSLFDLSEEEFEKLSKSLTVKSSVGDGKKRLRKLLNTPEFYRLIRKTFDKCLTDKASKTNQFTQEFYEEVGKELADLILSITPYQPIYRNDYQH